MSSPSPLDSLQIPSALACEFFSVFSRFEFALKESGYFYCFKRNSRIAPNWKKFADIAVLQAPAGSELALAMDFLNREPPQVQTAAHKWEPVPLRGTAPIATTLEAVQRIRNNLFHGGKYTPHSPPGRDEALLRAALVVLLACVAQNSNVGAAYASSCQNSFKPKQHLGTT